MKKIKLANSPITAPRYNIIQGMFTLSEVLDWGLQLLGVPQSWKATMGEDTKVCILDTGIDYNHPDLKDNINSVKDFTNSSSGALDINGHGTHCAGIIAASYNGHGVIGVAPKSQIMAGKVLGDDGFGSTDNIIKGIDWAMKNGADVISMSLGSEYEDLNLKAKIKEAFQQGIILVGAAGNEFRKNFVSFPAQYPECIAVGAINRNLIHSNFSNQGSDLDIVAPGEEVFSTFRSGSYAKLSGTSMATPFVSAICALILSKQKKYGSNTPIKNNADMRNHLIRNAQDLGPQGFDPAYGFGLINPLVSITTAVKNYKYSSPL